MKHPNKRRLCSSFFLPLLVLFVQSLSAQSVGEVPAPLIAGFHPDPSICRVGDDYYLVNSSFQYFPGVPLYHSTDLVHWEQIGNILSRPSQLALEGATSWQGIYAPTLRYHDGTFYLITTNVSGKGNFIVSATNPLGPWSEPLWLEQGGIDPSLFWEDGRCYMVSNPGDAIWLCTIDPDTGRQLTESKLLWRGMGGRYPEGPHLYKKDGYYYLLISEGGTELAHSLTIARSRSIEGPYEPNPDNPILTNCCQKGQYKTVQGTGHGDFVQAADGSWWITFLAYRHFGGMYHHLGRETFLAPVEWPEGGWPVVNGGAPIDTARVAPQQRLFTQPFTHPAWVYIQNPVPKRYEFLDDGTLRLHAGRPLVENQQPTFIGCRQEAANIIAEVDVTLTQSVARDEAGLSVYQINDGYQNFCVSRFGKGYSVKLEARLKTMVDTQMRMLRADHARLRITSDGEVYTYQFSEDEGKTWQTVGSHSCTLVSTEVAGGFTGVVIGLYAAGNPDSYADFRTPCGL